MQCMLMYTEEDLGPLQHLRAFCDSSQRLSIKMKIVVDKYPLTITVKILHEYFFFQSKML